MEVHKTMKVQKRTMAQWQTLIDEQSKSGLKGQAWCKANGINYGAFKSAEKRLRKKAACGTAQGNNTDGKWIELQIPKKGSEKVSPVGQIEVRIGKFCITVTDTFSETALKRVCKALGELC